jgi:hypothetical protein
MDVNPYALVDGLSNVTGTNVFVYGGDLSAIVFDNFAITMKTYFDSSLSLAREPAKCSASR